jgi:4-diphosphocytidyl-2-C-methyl-D-erythritol kinase
MSSLRATHVLAPAKINLSLRIVGRRADGYHLLDSLMAPIDWYDEMDVVVDEGRARGIVVTCDVPELPSGRENLAYRAAALFLDRTGIAARVSISLRKRIPPASGLGGGSSDAAAVLATLNRLLETGCSAVQMAQWGVSIGADVPFFVYGRPGRVGGIGEKFTPEAGWGGVPLVVARPPRGLATAAVFRSYDEVASERPASLTKWASVTSIANFVASGSSLREPLVNDLEAVAVEVYPEVLSLKRLLLDVGAGGALMTGSGSAVFSLWPSRTAAEVAAETVRGRGYWAVAAQTIELSPVAA